MASADRPAVLSTTLDEIARQRIRGWLSATSTTQAALADRIGKTPAWMSRYLLGEFNADLETLRAIAHVFSLSVSALFDSPSDPDDRLLLEAFHGLRPDGRQILLQLARHMVGRKPAAGKR
jgi:transcriptional regulator with XRE-family HTH domain